VGSTSDLVAASIFKGAAAFALACPGGAAPEAAAGALRAACLGALSGGTHVALLACTPLILWGAIHYIFAARHVRRDLPQ
jgi:hypothetical protein